MKWTEEKIEEEILKAMEFLGIKRMPTSIELRGNHMTGLCRAIVESGGFLSWANRLNLETKKQSIKWNNKRIRTEILQSMKVLQIDRMPTASELQSIGKNDLHCAISRSDNKYTGWSEVLKLERKQSETDTGNQHEYLVMKKIREISNHLTVKKMSTNHPYDLLINDCVKVDVKVGTAHYHFGSRAHTFGIHKKYATCDIYICVALDENEKLENYFIIPAAKLRLTTLNIGVDSKYNKYKNTWSFVYQFVNSYEKALSIV